MLNQLIECIPILKEYLKKSIMQRHHLILYCLHNLTVKRDGVVLLDVHLNGKTAFEKYGVRPILSWWTVRDSVSPAGSVTVRL